MSKLSAKAREHLAPNQFALSDGRFPINDAEHARKALQLLPKAEKAGSVTEAEAATVRKRANNFLDAHTNRDSHADSVK